MPEGDTTRLDACSLSRQSRWPQCSSPAEPNLLQMQHGLGQERCRAWRRELIGTYVTKATRAAAAGAASKNACSSSRAAGSLPSHSPATTAHGSLVCRRKKIPQLWLKQIGDGAAPSLCKI